MYARPPEPRQNKVRQHVLSNVHDVTHTTVDGDAQLSFRLDSSELALLIGTVEGQKTIEQIISSVIMEEAPELKGKADIKWVIDPDATELNFHYGLMDMETVVEKQPVIEQAIKKAATKTRTHSSTTTSVHLN